MPTFQPRLLVLLCIFTISVLSRGTMSSFASSASRAPRFLVNLRSPTSNGRNSLAVKSPGGKASATSAYEVVMQEPGTSLDGLQVCVWIDSTTGAKQQPTRSGPFCFEGPRRNLPMQGLEVGSHRLSAAVVAPVEAGERRGSPRNHEPNLLSSVASTDFDVVIREDYLPSYEWREVYPWQSIPPGLEVQLPLDGVTQRRARIPPCWRLQLYVEGVEPEVGRDGKKTFKGFFLRTDLKAESTVLDLRREIARQSKVDLSVEHVKLILDRRVLEDGDTVGALDLFNRQRDLVPVVDW